MISTPGKMTTNESLRPDGRPWLTRDQILDKLDRTLSLCEKASIQRTSEEDAQKCALCWLAELVDNEVCIGGPRFLYYARNPLIPENNAGKSCRTRKCDETTAQTAKRPREFP